MDFSGFNRFYPVKTLRKSMASFCLFVFIFNQILPPAFSSIAMPVSQDQSLEQALSAEEAAEKQAQNAAADLAGTAQTTQDFLQGARPLSGVPP